MEYDWEGGPGTGFGLDGHRSGLAFGSGAIPIGIYRRVVERRVYADGSTLTEKTKYTEEVNASGTSPGIVTVDQLPVSGTTPLARSKHYFYGSAVASLSPPNDPTDYEFIENGREYKTETYDSDGVTLLRKTENNWQPRVTYAWTSADLRLMDVTNTIVDGNLVTKQFFAYSPDEYNNQTDVWEHDFGNGSPGSLIRHSHTNYKTDGYDTVAGGISNPNPDATIHIRSLPTQQYVYDTNGVERARTTYEYDTTPLGALVDRAGITGLVSRSGQAAGAGYIPVSDTMRGNVTQVSRWSLANTGLEPPLNTDRAISSFSQYDIAGNVVKVRDPNTNETQFDYTDNFSGSFTANTFAFLKSTTSPNPGATYGGNMPLVSTSKYDFSSGKVIEATDPNLKITTFEYNDPLDRLTKVIRPSGGGQTIYEYGDSVGNLYLRTQTQQSTFPSVWLEDYALFDGLGRAKRSAHYEGTLGWSVRESQYDALGRVSQVSNPFFAPTYSAGAGSAWTTSTYDALSRVTQIATPDNALVKTTYLGNQVTVEDQAGKKRSSITDGLGRLIQVNEAPNDSAYNYQTNYTYDVLGNLIRVRQGGFPTGGSSDPSVQFRRFYYDSLSRLVYANNPEQNATIAFNPPGEAGTMWTMKYVYDDNGNLTSRTDARNVMTTYGYDALNRNTTVEYSNTPGITGPDIKRFYDTATNGKGRLQRVESYLISPQNSSRVDSQTIINGYDNLGRVISQTQGFRKPDSTWQNFTALRNNNSYDLVGHVTFQSNPSGSYEYFQFNAGGRSLQSWGTLGADSVETFYSSGTQYNAAGQLAQEVLGQFTYHRMDYNNRFQMTEVRISTNPFDPMSWDLGKLRFFYNTAAKNSGSPNDPGTDNNGNVLRQEHWVPTSVSNVVQGGNTVKVVNQYAVPMRDDYSYDPINRITQVQGYQQTTGPATPVQIYQQTYSYDKFGNRKLDGAQTWGNLINGTDKEDVYDVDKLTNRLMAKVYDPAGNLLSLESVNVNLEKLVYDAENRMVSAQSGSSSGYYVYDGDGRRVRRIVNGVENWQVYGIDGELLAEYQWNGSTVTLKKEYGYRDGQLLVVADPTETNANKRVQWLVADHLGTPRMVVDKTGSLSGVTRHDYLPFGEELMVGMGGTGNPPSPLIVRNVALGYQQADSVRQKFTGYERDAESGLDFAQSRHYSAIQGRFAKPDIFGGKLTNPQTLNLYAYVLNNPLKWSDPTGHFAQDPLKPTKDKDDHGNPIYECDDCTVVIDSGDEPSLIESIIPIYGSYLDARHNFNTGHPIKGTLHAAMAVSDIALLKSAVVGLGKLGVKAFTREATERIIVRNGLAETGVIITSGLGGEAGEMVLHRVIKHGEKLDDIVNEAKALTFTTGNEYALVTLANGERAIVSGSSFGINFLDGQITRIWGHTHPDFSLPSLFDVDAIRRLGNSQQTVFTMTGGSVTKVRPTGATLPSSIPKPRN